VTADDASELELLRAKPTGGHIAMKRSEVNSCFIAGTTVNFAVAAESVVPSRFPVSSTIATRQWQRDKCQNKRQDDKDGNDNDRLGTFLGNGLGRMG
jgi:hypothetical protein